MRLTSAWSEQIFDECLEQVSRAARLILAAVDEKVDVPERRHLAHSFEDALVLHVRVNDVDESGV